MLGKSLRSGIVPLVLGWAALSSHATQVPPAAPSNVVQEHLVAISATLRCLVCKGESLYGSDTELAQDLRREIQAMIAQGKSDQEIRNILLGRYGDFLVYEAPGTAESFWWGLTVVPVLAGAGLLLYLRRRAGRSGAPVRRY